jgi:hypothetical protein
VALLGLLAALAVVVNHQWILASPGTPRVRDSGDTSIARVARGEGPTGTDIKSLGAWLRAESSGTGRLSEKNRQHPFYMWIPSRGEDFIWRIFLEYEIGNPGWTSAPELGDKRPPIEKAVAGLARGQIMIAPERVAHPGLREVTRIGIYWIYEAKQRGRQHRRRAAELRQGSHGHERGQEVGIGKE